MGPLARQSLTPLVCAGGARWKEREKKRKKKRRKKTNARSIERGATPRFALLLCTAPLARCSLRRAPRHNALSSPTRTVSRYAIVEDPCPPPPSPAHFSLWRRKSRRRNVPRNLHEFLTAGTRAYAYKRTAAFRPPLLPRNKFRPSHVAWYAEN